MPVHGIDDGNNKHAVYTAEEVLAILQQAIDSGSLQGIDPEKNPIVAAVRESHNNSNLTFWSGTEAEFNEMTGVTSELIGARIGSDGRLYLLTGDTTLSDTVEAARQAALEATEGMKREVISVTLLANAWSNTAPYTQTVTVPGMTADKDFLAPYVVPTGNESDDLAAQAALSCISGGTTDTDSVTFYCYDEKPTTTITVFMVDKGTKIESGDFPIASTTAPGIMQVGEGLNVTPEGEVSVAAIEQSGYFFDNVAAMVAYNLSAGDTVQTLGYYAANDGGAAQYKIVESGATADGGNIIALDNNLKAQLVMPKDKVNVKLFGAKGDDSNDDTTAIQKAIDYAFSSEIYSVFLPSGTYKTTKPLFLYEKCEICGENYSASIIHKTTHDKGNVDGMQADAIIILADSTFATGSTVSTDVRNNEKINNLTIQGCVEAYESGKTDADKQYGIWCIGYAPKSHIDKLWIRRTDVGIKVVGMYVSHIRDCLITTWYSGIRVTSECQGLTVANINTVANHEIGIELSGATYGSIQSCLVELTYNSTAYKFTDWHGDMTGCGTELGDGANIGIRAMRSKIRITGGYFYTPTGATQDNNKMLVVNASTITVSNSVFGSYDMTTSFRGKFADIFNGNVIVEDSNKFLCSFTEDTTGNGAAFLTINGKSIDLLRDITLLQSSTKNHSDSFDYLNAAINPTKKFPRSDIYFGNVTNPYTNDVAGRNDWGPAYNKGDMGFFKNALATGKAGWICNRDNHSDLDKSAGTITEVDGNNITLSDISTEAYQSTGIRFFRNCKIQGVTSGATGRISAINGNKITLTERNGSFQTDEKIQMVSENFWVYADYLYIPIINSGETSTRPTQGLVVGQMYFDTTLNKPIWYKGSNKWVDSTGAEV